MKWADLGEPVKVLISAGSSAITTLAGALVFMFTNFTPTDDHAFVLGQLEQFETVASAETWRTQHERAIDCKTVADLRADIRELEAQIRFDRTLTDEDREWLRQQIQAIREEIARRDPKGVC